MKWDTRGSTATVSICAAGGRVLDSFSMSIDDWKAAWNGGSSSVGVSSSQIPLFQQGEMSWGLSSNYRSAGSTDLLN
jgi:hypothetical protein